MLASTMRLPDVYLDCVAFIGGASAEKKPPRRRYALRNEFALGHGARFHTSSGLLLN
jgi:hypothetical protein